jgi:hypothetical protein
VQRIIFLLVFGATGLNLFAEPDNIALYAKVTVSSELSSESGGGNAIDRRIGVDNRYEWVSNSRMTYWGQIDYPWIQPKKVDWVYPDLKPTQPKFCLFAGKHKIRFNFESGGFNLMGFRFTRTGD